MKTNVQPTSLAAYRRLDLAPSAHKLLAAMKPGIPYTDREIAAILGEDSGWVPDRRHKLIAAGLVERAEDKYSARSKTLVMAHRLVAQQAELELTA